MTELCELFQIGFVNAAETECPFDHEASEPPNVSNDLVGVGSALASNMKNASSTFLYDKYRKDQKPDSVPNPRDDPMDQNLYQGGARKPRPVVLCIQKEKESKPYEHAYPVTCAAHHCIPAQESLKASQLLEYMVKKHGREKLKEGKEFIHFTAGVVWADVGYDVNGVENGVYLPGNYAVGGGKGGMGVWGGDDGNQDDDEDHSEVTPANTDISKDAVEAFSRLDDIDGPVEDSAPSSNRLDGQNYKIDQNNRKWRYVKQAMLLAKGQFHDRHEPYSNHVLGRLQKIYNNYVLLQETKHKDCKKCQDKANLIKEYGVPTPFRLVARLNGISAFLRGYLKGSFWSDQLFTSAWVQNYVRSRKNPR